IYRPEYYKLDVWDDEQGTPCAGQAEFIIAKHRNGALENVRLRFVNEQAKFTDLEEDLGFSGFEFQSSMNKDDSGSMEIGSSINLPVGNPEDSFGAMDDFSADFDDEDDDNMPFYSPDSNIIKSKDCIP